MRHPRGAIRAKAARGRSGLSSASRKATCHRRSAWGWWPTTPLALDLQFVSALLADLRAATLAVPASSSDIGAGVLGLVIGECPR